MKKRVPQSRKDAFAKKMKAWRTRENLTQEAAAERLGTVIHNIRNWEQARQMPQGVAAAMILKVISP